MRRKTIFLAIAVAALSGGAFFYFNSGTSETARVLIEPSDAALVAHGKSIYTTHCAACHGAKLEGQPEWRKRLPNGRLPAPPHDESGHTWHHPDGVLFDIVKNGLVPGRTAPAGYESDMPAYAQVLTDGDIVAVLAYIKSTWPPEILALQKNVTLQQSRK